MTNEQKRLATQMSAVRESKTFVVWGSFRQMETKTGYFPRTPAEIISVFDLRNNSTANLYLKLFYIFFVPSLIYDKLK